MAQLKIDVLYNYQVGTDCLNLKPKMMTKTMMIYHSKKKNDTPIE